MHIISPAQCRAARALLNWSQPDLAERAGMHVQTISSFENETGTPTKTTLEKIVDALEKAGIEFTPQEGVRKNNQEILTYVGRDDFAEFMWDVTRTVEKMGGDICVSNVKEVWFTSPLTEEINFAYRAKMTQIKRTRKFNFRIIIEEGDSDFVASAYAEYRWIESKYFKAAPFYVYGDKLAIMKFDKEPVVHVVRSKEVADAYRTQFDIIWDMAKVPPKAK